MPIAMRQGYEQWVSAHIEQAINNVKILALEAQGPDMNQSSKVTLIMIIRHQLDRQLMDKEFVTKDSKNNIATMWG